MSKFVDDLCVPRPSLSDSLESSRVGSFTYSCGADPWSRATGVDGWCGVEKVFVVVVVVVVVVVGGEHLDVWRRAML